MKTNYEKEARQVCAAIKKMAENENTLNNFEIYLSFHFKEWLKKFANTPQDMACELQEFAKIG